MIYMENIGKIEENIGKIEENRGNRGTHHSKNCYLFLDSIICSKIQIKMLNV
jgi:hypothetical protein